MKIFIGADHRGFALKNKIKEYLIEKGYSIEDLGTFQDETPCDYPKISKDLAQAVAKSSRGKGILFCMTGIGHAIAANKVKGCYAALCYNLEAAKLSRQHNNSNVLVLGAKFVGEKKMLPIVEAWLTTEFEGGRHLRRFKQIKQIEKEFCDSKIKKEKKF